MTEPAGESILSLIDGHFTVDFSLPLPEAGGGHPAFAVRSARMGPGFMAVQVQRGWPVRADHLTTVSAAPISNMLVPFGHGVAPMPSGEMGYFVVCQAPAGRAVGTDPRPWSDAELIDLLLRPAAAALSELHARGATHRAIRPDNVFRSGQSDAVTLGCAWASPPASRQPCVFEPPYVATCLPAGRGDGAPADDVYALGVLLVALAMGRTPMADSDPDAIIRAKLDEGSFAAIVGQNRLSTAVVELARGMLADDPEHRPTTHLLADPAAARARRAAARPQRRAQRALPLGDVQAWTARDVARAIMVHPEQGASQLRTGAVGLWLRRGLGDGAMASRLDEVCGMRDGATRAEEPRADALLTVRAVAVMDQLAPLSWRRLALWPDGIGPALNQALTSDPAQAAELTEIAGTDVMAAFAHLRPERSDLARLKVDARRIQACMAVKQIELATLRLNYALNPLAPCDSPLLTGSWVTRLPDILPALERAAAGPLREKLPPFDRHIAAFVGMRRDERSQGDLGQLANQATPGDPLSQLRLFARLQDRTYPEKLPALTAWMAELVMPLTEAFQGKSRRSKLAERLAELGRGGLMVPLLAMLDDPASVSADRVAYQQAASRCAAIENELGALERTSDIRKAAAAKIAQNVTSGISLAACGLALAAAAFL